jgi:hypothetical protein
MWPLLGFLGIAAMAVLFETRPHTFSWLFLNLTLLILEGYREGKTRLLFVLVPLIIVWVNTHPLFILGWVAIGCFAVADTWERKDLRSPILRVLALCIAVSLVNPYGIDGVLLPFQQFQFLQPTNIFKATIAEYQSPLFLSGYIVNGTFVLLQPQFAFHCFLLMSLITIAWTFRRRRPADLLLFLVFLYIAVTGVKNIGYDVIAVLPMLAAGPYVARTGSPWPLGVKISALFSDISGRRVTAAVTLILTAFILWQVVTDRYYISYRSNERFGYRMNRLTLPVGAAQFIRTNGLEGRVLNHFNEGGFLMWALEGPVAIDGRNELIGEEFYLSYMQAWYDSNKNGILRTYLPDIVVIPHFYEQSWISFFAADTSWRLAYFDHLSAVYLRNGYAPNIPAADPLQWMPQGSGVDAATVDDALRQLDPGPSIVGLFRRQHYPQKWIGLSSFAFNQNWLEASVLYGIEALRTTTVSAPELYFNLGNIFFAAEDWHRAAYCYGRFLMTNEDALARERYAWMELRGLNR